MFARLPQHLRFYWLRLSLLVLVSVMTAEPLRAQAIDSIQQLPNPIPPIPSQTPTPTPLPTSSPLPALQEPLPASSPTLEPVDELSDETDTIVVERFEFVGNTVFSHEELEEITKPFIGKKITFRELLKARSAVALLYYERGYITSGAFLPRQRIRVGVVTIRVVEGKLEDIKIKGTQRLNPDYIRSRLTVATSEPLNQNRLEEALRLLQLNPLIEKLSAELSAGSRSDLSLLEVRVTEAKTFSAQATVDNRRSPSVGSFQRRLQLGEANLLGLGDGLSISYSNTDGSNALDASYTLPFNPNNGTVGFRYGRTSSHVIEPPFDRLDIEGKSRSYELTLRQPVVQTATQKSTQEFALGLTASRLESDTSLKEIPFPLAPGADAQGRTRISALRFFQEWTHRGRQEVIAVRSQFSLGLDLLNSTINETGPDSRFFTWRGQAQWVRLLAPPDTNTVLLIRANAQLADRALVSLEQFAIGGFDSVRGYRQDFLLTDNGIFASVELQLPILRVRRWQGVLQVIPFVEYGTGWNSSGSIAPALKINTLSSLGLGLQWRQERFRARLDWGIPLVDTTSRKRTWQENGLYFSVEYNPF